MEIKLSPEIAALVESGVASGRYGSAEEYVGRAVEMLHDREPDWDTILVEQREQLEASLKEAELDEDMSLEEVQEEMREMKARWMAERRIA